MKKLIAVTIAVLLLAGCGAATGVKVGLGHSISIARSTDAAAGKDGSAIVSTVMTAAAFDANGKILGVSIDAADSTVNFNAQGKITSKLDEKQKSKVELGKDYGMIAASKIGKEWYEQVAELEKWMKGKTVDQVKAMKVKSEASGGNVTDETDLNTKVTITVDDFLFTLEEAYKNAK
jgi:hypothetical protein